MNPIYSICYIRPRAKAAQYANVGNGYILSSALQAVHPALYNHQQKPPANISEFGRLSRFPTGVLISGLLKKHHS